MHRTSHDAATTGILAYGRQGLKERYTSPVGSPQGLAGLPCQTPGGFEDDFEGSHIHPGNVRDELHVASPSDQLRAA